MGEDDDDDEENPSLLSFGAHQQGFFEEGREVQTVNSLEMMVAESTSYGGNERERSLVGYCRPSREELVRIYLLRKRRMDKRCHEPQEEVEPPLPSSTWDTLQPTSEVELVSEAIDIFSAGKKRITCLDENEENMPPPKRLRNRMKAQKARDRKMVQLRNLESKVEELEKKNAELEGMCSTLTHENEKLRNDIMDGNSSGKEELMNHYKSLENDVKEDLLEKVEEADSDGILDQDNSEALNSYMVQSTMDLIDVKEPYHGRLFDSEMLAREFYAEYAWHVGFATRTDKCRRSEKDGAVIWRKFVCSREGFTRAKDKCDDRKIRRNRPSMRTGCPAFVEVTRRSDGKWAVTKFHKEHNHKMFCRESERLLLSNTCLEENVVNGDMVVAKEEEWELDLEETDSSRVQMSTSKPCVGMLFRSETAAKEFYNEYSRHKGFVSRTDKCRRSEKDGAVIWRRFTCSREGLNRTKENGDNGKSRRVRLTTRTGCLALLEITRKKDGNWNITKYHDEHNHKLSSPGAIQHTQFYMQLVDTKKDLKKLGNNFKSFLLKTGNTTASVVHSALTYFKHKKEENPSFYYELQEGKEEHMVNLLWVDSWAQIAYTCFGDVLIFETSCKKDSGALYAFFTGVNHHRQRILFGCALLMDTSEDSLRWAFSKWSKALGEIHPVTVITDRNPVVQAALSKELPNSHQWCKHWQVLKQCKQMIPDLYKKQSTFKKELKVCVNKSESPEEFEVKWKEFVEIYSLGGNKWIQDLYDCREQWAPAYQRRFFCAELDPKRQIEPIEKLFECCTDPTTNFHHLLMQYERAIEKIRVEEKHADMRSINGRPCHRTCSPLESQAAEIFTREVFQIFQERLAEAFAFKVNKVDNDGNDETSTYRLGRYMMPNVTNCTVQFNATAMVASCSCRNFEFSGMLCSHILAVLLLVQKPVIPEHYIVSRWRRTAKTGLCQDENGEYKTTTSFCDEYRGILDEGEETDMATREVDVDATNVEIEMTSNQTESDD